MSYETYNSGVPNPPNSPKVDVPIMKTNALAISNLISNDHFGFNNNAGGYHQQVHLKNEAAPGGLGANADSVLYANLANANSWPFWQNALGSIQLGGRNSIGANGYITLPSRASQPLISQWGSFNPNASTAVSFPLTFPNNVYAVFMTQSIDNNSTFRQASVSTGTLTTSGFTYEGTVSAHINPVYFFALGD